MVETFTRPENQEHFDISHIESGEVHICVSSDGECKILFEIDASYSPEEQQQLIQSSTNAIKAIDRFTAGRTADIFGGLSVFIGENLTYGGGHATAEDNKVVLAGSKMLLSVGEMRIASGAYDHHELAEFPDQNRPGGSLEYTLVHELGHILDGQTNEGIAYRRIESSESPTRYGRNMDEWNTDNKDHEAFAEGFAHAVWGMTVSPRMLTVITDTLQSRINEITLKPKTSPDQLATGNINLSTMSSEELSDWFGASNAHNGLHFMSPEDNQTYQELCENNLRSAIKFLRHKWGEYADHEFIKSFTLVHWVGESDSGLINLENLISSARSEVEISTQAYDMKHPLSGDKRWLKAKFGIIVDGQVNLASNEDIQTNQWTQRGRDDTQRQKKYTEWANRLLTNRDNCVSPYEFVVGDWKVAGIIMDMDTSHINKVKKLAQKYGLPVIDTSQDNILTQK